MRYQRSALLASACACVLAAATADTFAQEARKTASTLEEVVVTGSLIAGTPEDSALAVDVITQEQLENLGRPSNIDLVKSLSESGQVAGEANRYNLYPIGAATINLRNIGSRFTTVIFNSRRFPEQYSAGTGRFNNISWIPNAAIGSIEILKQGGAVTYGADAVGGVVNYLTRRNLDGVEINADYRYIEDSDGDYTTDVLWGKTFERGNFMVVGGYQHRSNLKSLDRDWATRHFLESPSWSANGSPGSYAFQQLVGATQTTIARPTTLTAPPSATSYIGERQMSSTGLVRDPNCGALGGYAGWSATPSPACYLNVQQFENLVVESDSYQLYTELNLKFADTIEFHGEGLYYQLDNPDIPTYPGDSPASWPLLNNGIGPLRQTIGVTLTPTYYVAGQNPAVGNFLNTFTNINGTTTSFTPAQIAAITSGGRAALLQGVWRPFGNGGNPAYGDTDSQHNNTKLYRVTAALKGDLPKFLGTSLKWDAGATYSITDYRIEMRDMLVTRLQNALNGFGGTACNGIRAGLAGSTCEWLNPFSSAIERNAYSGANNPGYVPALANSPALVQSLYVPIWLQRDYNNLIVDALVRGESGFDLPGGPIAVAAGVQYRYADEQFTVDDLSNRDINPCPTVGVDTCGTTNAGIFTAQETGPLAFTRNATVLGTTRNTKRYYPVVAGYLEAQLPILETLDLQIAGRYEKFYSDVTDKDNSIFVPAAAIKWQALNWLALRTSAGETFSQVNPPLNDGPTQTVVSTANNTFGGIQGYATNSYDNVGVEPEKGTYLDVGFIIQAGNFTSSVDYFDIRVNDYTRTMTANNVLRALVGPAIPGQPVTQAQVLDCNSPLFQPQPYLGGNPFVQIPGGCVPGTTLAAINSSAAINYWGGVGQTNSGQLKTTGIDLDASYSFENVFGGRLTPSIDATYNLIWELDDFVIGGVKVANGYDGVGFANRSTGRLSIAVPEWRGSIGLLYNRGRHTLNLLATFIPTIINEDESDFDASNDQNANIGDANGVVTTGNSPTTACAVPGSGLTSGEDNVPAGAGTGVFGGGSTGTAAVGTPLSNTTRGFCGDQNVAIGGREIESSMNIDLTYRVKITETMSMALTVYNLLDDDPSFDRAIIPYNSGFGSPLGRNFKLGFQVKFQ